MCNLHDDCCGEDRKVQAWEEVIALLTFKDMIWEDKYNRNSLTFTVLNNSLTLHREMQCNHAGIFLKRLTTYILFQSHICSKGKQIDVLR